MESITATVMKFIFVNEDSGFKILSTRTQAGKNLTITGEFGPDIVPETIAVFHGEIKSNKYGPQLKASSYVITHNAQELASIKIFLNSITEYVGPERSDALIAYFGTDTFNIIENKPERLLEVPGIGPVIADNIKMAWQSNREKWAKEKTVYSLRAFLCSLGLKEKKIKKVINHFTGREGDAETFIKNNPYALIELDDFGFTTVDYIARNLGTPLESPERFKAFIFYLLDYLCPSNGHLYMTAPEIVEQSEKYCKDNNTQFLNTDISSIEIFEAIKGNEKILLEDDTYIYSKRQYDLERNSAYLLEKNMNEKSDLIFLTDERIAEFIEKYEHEHQIELSDEQKQALYYFAEKKVFVITGGPGTGKCLGKDTPVIMFDGTIKKVQDIIPGDILMGDDSTPRNVLNICRGQEPLYRVTPIKGDPYVVNESHILSLKKTGTDTVIDIPLKEYLKKGERKIRLKGYKVPLDFEEKSVLIDPYLLGYWLGNGSSDGTGISTPFPEVIERLSNIVTKFGLSIKKNTGDNVDYNISCDRDSSFYKNLNDKRYPNEFLIALRESNLIDNKHIPLIYKANSRNIRLQLLAGILDSDGYFDKRSNCFEFSQKSEKFTKDVVFLARSLGFGVYPKLRKKKWNCVTKGKRYTGEDFYYVMSISGRGIEQIPTVVLKKKAPPRKQIKNVLLTGIKVEPIGIGDYYGFSIDGNRRFLLGDFTVTHNTSILKAIVELAKSLGLDLTCMTPTGISAKKLSTVINSDAYTIHRRLGFRGGAWTYNELRTYRTDVAIIDESSMVDQEVFFRMLSALEKRTHLIFVGDHNQLPSVGAGNVLRELINCGQVPVVKLEKIFRQDEASDIIKASHRIIQGDTNLELFKDNPGADISFLRIKEISEIERIVVALSSKFKTEKREFQILSPRNTGPCGVDSLNQILQETLNPPGALNEMKIRNFVIRVGDRVMVRKNDYENEIFNGDIGKVINISRGKILFSIDDRMVELSADEVNDKIKLAYSITVHKSQGLEYQTIILVFINQFGRNMLQRNLLYTALTRAKKKVIMIGHGSAIERAIENTSVIKRNTRLGERIRECLDLRRSPSSYTLP